MGYPPAINKAFVMNLTMRRDCSFIALGFCSYILHTSAENRFKTPIDLGGSPSPVPILRDVLPVHAFPRECGN